MDAFPHTYTIESTATGDDLLSSGNADLPTISVAPPRQFGGPGDQWSPEDLLMAAVANCFTLSFKAIARASRLEWIDIKVTATGELDNIDRQMRFTKVKTDAHLLLPADGDTAKAEKLLHKAEQTCLVTNSMSSEQAFACEVSLQD